MKAMTMTMTSMNEIKYQKTDKGREQTSDGEEVEKLPHHKMFALFFWGAKCAKAVNRTKTTQQNQNATKKPSPS